MTAIVAPLPQFFDTNGAPLQAGFVYIGAANANPETSPALVYWDEALTQPAEQPLRTRNGLIARSGNAAQVYVTGDYSMTVKNSAGVQVFYARSALASNNGLMVDELRADIASTATGKGSALVGYKYAASATGTTVEKRLKTEVWITDYLPDGYVLDGSVDYTTQIQAAHDEADTVHYPAGTFLMGTVYLDQGASVLGAGKWVTTFKIKSGASLGFATRAFGVRADGTPATFRLGLRLENFGIDLTLMANSDASRGIALEDSYDNVIRSVKAIDPLDETSSRWGLYLGRAFYTTGIYDCTFGRVALIAAAPIANFGTTVYFHHLDSWHVKGRYYQHVEFNGAVIQKDADKFDLDLAIDNWTIIGGDFENGGNFIRCTTTDSVANIFTAGNAFGGFSGTMFGGAAGRPRSSIFMDEYRTKAPRAITSCTRSGTTLTVQVDTTTAGAIYKSSAPIVGDEVTLAGTTNFDGNYIVATSDAVNNRFTVTVPASGANTTGGTVTPDPSVNYRYAGLFKNSLMYDELAGRLISRNRIVLGNARYLSGFAMDGSTEVTLIGLDANDRMRLGSLQQFVEENGHFRNVTPGKGFTVTSPDGLVSRTITINNSGVLTLI